MKESLLNLGTALTVSCALAVTGMVVRRELAPDAATPVPGQGIPVAAWTSLLPDQTVAPAGQVQLVVFADYTCRYCRQLDGALDSLQSALGSGVQVTRLHYPLRGAGTGFTAAVASECAALQQRGSAYHRLLYTHQQVLGVMPWDSLAVLAGVADRSAFNDCMDTERTAQAVRAQREQGEAVGVEGTPTFLVDGRRYAGGRSYTALLHLARPPSR